MAEGRHATIVDYKRPSGKANRFYPIKRSMKRTRHAPITARSSLNIPPPRLIAILDKS
jgi:hypothetical protein